MVIADMAPMDIPAMVDTGMGDSEVIDAMFLKVRVFRLDGKADASWRASRDIEGVPWYG